MKAIGWIVGIILLVVCLNGELVEGIRGRRVNNVAEDDGESS